MRKFLRTGYAFGMLFFGSMLGTYAVSQDFLGLITTDRLLGRDTAGTGQVEELTVGGGLEFTGSGGIQRSALTGDVTSAAGSGATNIDADKVGIDELDLIDGDTPVNGDCLTYDTGAGGTIEAITCPGGGAPTPDVQTFTATGAGTWTKPSGGQTMCRAELWGAGGSGGKGAAGQASGGGGGGAYTFRIYRMSDLGATETVSIATGGAAQTTASTAGNVGGNTTFGSGATLITAYGGGPGAAGNANRAGGGIGGQTTAAGTVGPSTGTGAGLVGAPGEYFHGASGGGASDTATDTNQPGSSSMYSGAGGGAGAEDSAPGAGIGGTSAIGGGNGGAGAFDANNATAGSQPGGGGGGAETGNSGAGGNGKAVVTCW